uniref:Uncharacterized protein n=1 Tax=Arcella intermedia TaxID=1963864 RepID=A0A6B2LNG0_9EUKA
MVRRDAVLVVLGEGAVGSVAGGVEGVLVPDGGVGEEDGVLVGEGVLAVALVGAWAGGVRVGVVGAGLLSLAGEGGADEGHGGGHGGGLGLAGEGGAGGGVRGVRWVDGVEVGGAGDGAEPPGGL